MTAVEPTVEAWAARIRPHLMRTVEAIVAAGRELEAAKVSLPHGSWGPLLDALGLSPHVARRLMRISRHPALGDGARVHDLPAAVGTLDVLLRLDEDELTEARETGEVTPSMTRPKL